MTRSACLADVPRVGDLGLVTHGNDIRRPAIIDPASHDALDSLLDLVDETALTTPAGQVVRLVVLLDDKDSGAASLLLSLVRAARDCDVVAVLSALPPLALAVLAEQLAVLLATYDDDGQSLAGLAALTADLDVLAWLGSVGGLAHLPTGVGQHLRSWVPGTTFLARASAPTAVVPTSDAGVAALLPSRVGRGAAVAVSAKGNTTWVEDVALPQLQAQTVVHATPPPPRPGRTARDDPPADPGRRWWGTARCVELVGYALDPLAVVAEVSPSHTCTWCGRPGSATTCPFCGMSLLVENRS